MLGGPHGVLSTGCLEGVGGAWLSSSKPQSQPHTCHPTHHCVTGNPLPKPAQPYVQCLLPAPAACRLGVHTDLQLSAPSWPSISQSPLPALVRGFEASPEPCPRVLAAPLSQEQQQVRSCAGGARGGRAGREPGDS